MNKDAPFYLMWYDADKKKSVNDKIKEAAEAYQRRFEYWPDMALLSSEIILSDVVLTEGVVGCRSYIQQNIIYVGRIES